ncbi:MAG: enoyl-CoA hydratase [Burkholderiales bacterium]|nr:enoyl-CoA hydratase [Burkholderiales bacterium]
MSEGVSITKADGILSIRFSRPDKKNAITRAMYLAMAEALLSIDASVRAVLFSGEGDSFSAGNDLKDFLAAPPQDDSHPTIHFIRALPKVPVPMVAAVHGSAVGIGTTLLLHCDVVIAASNAVFALPFTKLGLVPEAGSSLLLPQLMGYQRAARLLLLGDSFTAQEAERYGLVSQLVEPDQLEPATQKVVGKLRALPASALRATKALMKSESGRTMSRIDEELAVFKERLTSPELKEAATAFLEKRQPDFSKFS